MQRSKEMAIRNRHNEHEAIANVASEDDERTPMNGGGPTNSSVLLIYKLDMQ